MKVRELVETKVPAKIPRVAVYLPDELYQQLEQEAGQEERSLSQMALILIREALASRRRSRDDTANEKR